jgi:uncharacterized protein YggE
MRRRYLIPIALVAAVVASFATRGADAQSPPAGKSVTVVGTGTQEVDEPSRRSDRAARERAVDEAEAEAAKKAVADARERAGRLAAAAGLTLGELQRVEQRGGAGAPVPEQLLLPRAVRDLSPACSVIPAAPPPRRGSRPPRPVVPRPLCLDPGAVAITVSVTFAAS